MDLREMVLSAMDTMIADGKIEAMIAEKLEKTVASVVGDVLSGYGPFSQQLREAVKKSLALNGELKLPAYNASVVQIVERQLAAATKDILRRQVGEKLVKLLRPPPESIRLSELIDQFKAYVVEQHRSSCHCGEQAISAHIVDHRRDGGVLDGYWYLHLDENAGKKHQDCEIALGVAVDKIFNMRLAHWGSTNQLFADPGFYTFEKTLFDMKVAGTKLIRDVEQSDLCLSYDMETV